jgi:hypothetical protein
VSARRSARESGAETQTSVAGAAATDVAKARRGEEEEGAYRAASLPESAEAGAVSLPGRVIGGCGSGIRYAVRRHQAA